MFVMARLLEYAGFSRDIGLGNNGAHVISWGRIGMIHADIDAGLRERGTGAKLWNILETEIESYDSLMYLTRNSRCLRAGKLCQGFSSATETATPQACDSIIINQRQSLSEDVTNDFGLFTVQSLLSADPTSSRQRDAWQPAACS